MGLWQRFKALTIVQFLTAVGLLGIVLAIVIKLLRDA